MVVDPTTHQPVQLVSVYRRPRMAANLPFAYTTSADIPANGPAPGEFGQGSVVNSTYCGFADDMGPALGRAGFLIVPGTPIVVTPTTSVKPPYVEAGLCTSGNIMWDGREPTLESQAIDATLGHAQAVTPPTADQVAQMVAFENAFFSAQSRDSQGDLLSSVASPGTAAAGPQYMAQLSTPLTPAILDGTAAPAVGSPGSGAPGLTFFSNWSASKKALQASIYRGQQIFNGGVSFAITDVAGLDNIPFPPGGPGATLGSAGIFNQGASCGVCHSQTAGNDTVAYAQHDLAVGGTPPIPGAVVASAPSPDLPIFKLTCNATASTAFPPTEGTTFYTNDPGLALITGKCADIGRRTVPQLRGLASHAPYFSNGSAATLADVVTFYNTRFNMKLTAQQQTDLVNFLNSL